MGIIQFFNDVRNRRQIKSAGLYDAFIDFPVADGSQGFAVDASTQTLYCDIAGIWEDLSGGGGGGTVTGNGAAGQVAYWDAASNITGDPAFLYNDTTKELSVQTGAALLGTPMGRFRNSNANSLAFFAVENDTPDRRFGLTAAGSNYVTFYDLQDRAYVTATSGFRSLRIVTNGDIENGGLMPIEIQPGGFNDFGMGRFDRNSVRLGRTGNPLTQVTILNTGEVGMGKYTPVNSAALDMTGWLNKGFLMPSLTTVQRNAIVSPADGVQVYDIDVDSVMYYNGIEWVGLAVKSFLRGTVGVASRVLPMIVGGLTYYLPVSTSYTPATLFAIVIDAATSSANWCAGIFTATGVTIYSTNAILLPNTSQIYADSGGTTLYSPGSYIGATADTDCYLLSSVSILGPTISC